MDKPLIEAKLESLRRCARRIEEKRPDSAEQLVASPDLQDIVALNLTRAVQLCVDIAAHVIAESETPVPTSMATTFDALVEMGVLTAATAMNLKKAVGFRNIAVHNYRAIDWQIVFDISHRCLEDFRAFARDVSVIL